MNFQFYFEKLSSSKEFRKFIKDYPDAYSCSCFFVIDLENKGGGGERQHFDYYVPSANKIFSFQLESECKVVPVETAEARKPAEISLNHCFNFSDVERIIQDRMNNGGISSRMQRMLFSIQNINGEDFLLGTIFISGLGLVRANIRISSMEIVEFEKKSFFDIVRVGGKKGKF